MPHAMQCNAEDKACNPARPIGDAPVALPTCHKADCQLVLPTLCPCRWLCPSRSCSTPHLTRMWAWCACLCAGELEAGSDSLLSQQQQ
jgi:hypothetical protein